MVKIIEEIEGDRITLVIDRFIPKNKELGFVPAILYHIVFNEENKVIGHCSAKLGWNESMYYCGHIGFSIQEEYRGNGYAVDAVNLLKKVFKENNIKQIYITNNPDNKASIRVCEKVGAKLVKMMAFSEEELKKFAASDSYKNIWQLKI